MSQHLSREEIEKYIARESAPADILRIDDHLAACGECMQMIERAPEIDAVLKVLASAETEQHLSFETIAKFADDTLVEAEREIADVHLSECPSCSEAVRDVRAMREVLMDAPAADVPKPEVSGRTKTAFPWWKVLIPVMASVMVGAFVWILLRTDGPQTPEIANLSNSNPNAASVAQAPSPRPDANSLNPNVDQRASGVMASINDGGGRIEVDEEGRITGIAADQFAQKIRAALNNQTVDVSSDARRLRTTSGTLMGPSGPGVPFRLVGPVGRIVEMDRPPFRWRPMKDAESYKVGIYDENYRLIAESPALKTTEWTPANPLPRGRVYQWQVAANVGGKDIISPTRPAAEAKFKVLDADAAAEIQQARRVAGNSKLLMGIVYANAGLIPEAEREFQALVQKNPGSQTARKLLAKVRSAR